MSQPAAPAATIVTTRFLNQFGPPKPASPGGAARGSARSAMRRRTAKQQQERSYPDGEGGEQPNNVDRQKCYDAGHNLRLIDRSKARGRMLAESYRRISVARN